MSGRIGGVRCAVAGVVVLFAPSSAVARDYGLRTVADSREELQALIDEGELDEGAALSLMAMIEHPVDLNRANRSALCELPEVTYEIAADIVKWRNEVRPFEEVDELLSVPGITRRVFVAVVPFITVAPVGVAGGAMTEASAEARLGLMTGRGSRAVGSERANVPQGFMSAQASGMAGLSTGLLATWRERTSVVFDEAYGRLASEGPRPQADLDAMYLMLERPSWRVLFGSYTLGFGERLTFDTTDLREPNGFYTAGGLLVDRKRAQLRPERGAFGAVASVSGFELPFGAVEGTLFLSSQLVDIYQYGSVDCVGDSAYACRVAHLGDSARQHTSVTFRDALRESFVGFNMTLTPNETWRLGVTGYAGHAGIAIDSQGELRFASSSPYAERNVFGAVGIHGRMRLGSFLLSAEYAYSGASGHAAYARATVNPAVWWEARLAVRYYSPEFFNPYAGGDAAVDQYRGMRARNELGARLDVSVRPFRRLRIDASVDTWRKVAEEGNGSSGQPRLLPMSGVPVDLRLRERLSYSLTGAEDLALSVEYIRHGSDDESESGGTFDEGELDSQGFEASGSEAVARARAADPQEGDGESLRARYKVRFTTATSRIPGLFFSAGPMWDATRVGQEVIDTQRKLRLRLRFVARALRETTFSLMIAYGKQRRLDVSIGQRAAGVVDRARADPWESSFDGVMEAAQMIGEFWSLCLQVSLERDAIAGEGRNIWKGAAKFVAGVRW